MFKKHTEPSWDALFRFAISLTKNEPEAEDLVQQTLLKALASFPAFLKTNYQLESDEIALEFAQNSDTELLNRHTMNWIMKIAKNAFLDNRNRASQRLTHLPLAEWDEEQSSKTIDTPSITSSDLSESIQELEQQFYQQALDDEWTEKFATLNPKQRSVLFLTAEDYSYKEIAQLLDIPIGTVMSTLNRAIKKLRNIQK